MQLGLEFTIFDLINQLCNLLLDSSRFKFSLVSFLMCLPLTVPLPPTSLVMRVTEADSDIRSWLKSMRQTSADSPSTTWVFVKNSATSDNVWGGCVVAGKERERV